MTALSPTRVPVLKVTCTTGPGKEGSDLRICSSEGALRLLGLVVKASAPKAEGPEFESRFRRDFSGVESYQ